MLKGKNIVVTGANRGIGLAIVERCAQNGANVWACMRSEPDVEVQGLVRRLEIEHHVWIQMVKLDVSDEESIQKAKEAILKEKLPVSGLVNNAGISGENKLFSMTSIKEIRSVFEVNFFGPMHFTQKLVKNMIKQKQGTIVNIASVAAIDGEPAQFGYVSSKAAMIGATKKLAAELANFGIRVNAVAPGVTDTAMIQNMSAEMLEQTLARVMLHRLGKPKEVADAVVYLLSDHSSYMTGQVVRIDGGGL